MISRNGIRRDYIMLRRILKYSTNHAVRDIIARSPAVQTRDEKAVDFSIPKEISSYLEELDDFIEKEIKPLERKDDNIRFFDHRREWARTDFENQGLPRHEWEALLGERSKLAHKAGP